MLFAGFSDTARRIAVAALITSIFFTGASWGTGFGFVSETEARFQEGQFLPAIFGDPYRAMNQAGIRPFRVTAVANAFGVSGATQHAVTFMNMSAAWQVVTLGSFTAMSIGNIPSSFLIGPKEMKTFFGIEFYEDGREQYIEFRTNKNAIRAFGARAADILARGLFAQALSSDNFRGDNLPELVGAIAPDIALDVLTNLLSSGGTGVSNILAENLNRTVQSSNAHAEPIASLMQQATNNPEAARRYRALAAMNALNAILTIKSALELPETINLTIELVGGTIASPDTATVFLRAIPQGTPRITRIDHVRGLNAQQPIQIHGLGFQRGAKVTLTASDGTYPIPAGRTFFVSENLIEISANVTDVTDLWFAQVENPEGQTSARYFFLVIASNQWVRFEELTNPRPAERQEINVLPIMESLGALRDSLLQFLNQIDVGDGLNRFRPDNLPNFVLTSQGEIVPTTLTPEGTPTPGNSAGIVPFQGPGYLIVSIIWGGDVQKTYSIGQYPSEGDARSHEQEIGDIISVSREGNFERHGISFTGPSPAHHSEVLTLEGFRRAFPERFPPIPRPREGVEFSEILSGGVTRIFPPQIDSSYSVEVFVGVREDTPVGTMWGENGATFWRAPQNTTGSSQTYTVFVRKTRGGSIGTSPFGSITVLPLDTTPPTITLQGDASVELMKGSEWSDLGARAEDNGSVIPVEVQGEVNTDVAGTYSVVYIARDATGNESSVTRVVRVLEPDTTPPVVTGVTDGEITNRSITITWNEGTGTLDGTSVETGRAVSGEGVHHLSVTDTAGNTTSLSFTLDLTPPLIAGVVNGDVYSASVTPTFSDTYGLKSATLAKDGAPAGTYASGTPVTENGAYTLVVEDTAGNKATFTFTIRIPQPASEMFEFTLSVPNGTSYVHVPLQVDGLERVSDLVALLGEGNVHNVAVALEDIHIRMFYPGRTKKGSSTDIKLEPYTAVRLRMRQGVQVTLRGHKLEGRIELRKGVNYVGVPLKGGIQRVSDLFALSASIYRIGWIDESGRSKQLQLIRGEQYGTDAEIRGGMGLIVSMSYAGTSATLTIEGEAWGTPVPQATSRIMRASPNEESTQLLPNFPNPFNPETWIPFMLGEDAYLTLTIYSAAGAPVRTLELGLTLRGVYVTKDKAIPWDGRNDNGEPVASGTYFAVLTDGTFRIVRKLLVVR